MDECQNILDWGGVNPRLLLGRLFSLSIEPKAFARAIIQFVHHHPNLLLGNGGKRPLLGEILANEPIRIFLESAFPCGIGMCKEEAHPEGFRDGFMLGKFSAVL